MRIAYHRIFKKRLARLPRSLRDAFYSRQDVWLTDRRSLLLEDHRLSGAYDRCRSFSVTGDVRVIYRFESPDLASFLDIGTHHELYGS
jgi:mRNA-degrading endonuclease YafQ of YafQ-DinJ toxin-antitoxin module